MAASDKAFQGLTPEQLAELKAEVKAELRAEANINHKPVQNLERTNDWLEEYVTIELFKDGKDYKDDVYLAINGENVVIKRGMPVKVKRKFALLAESSRRQDIMANTYAEAAEREYRRNSANI